MCIVLFLSFAFLFRWANVGGALLGTNRSYPQTIEELKLVADAFKKHNVRVNWISDELLTVKKGGKN
jgi:hypothetical protein